MQKDSTIFIKSRTHDIDITGAIIECSSKHAMPQHAAKPPGWNHIEVDCIYTNDAVLKNVEHRRIEAMIPWLDGARECVETIYFWQHAL